MVEDTSTALPIYVEDEEIFEEGWSDDQDGEDVEKASDKASEIDMEATPKILEPSQRDPQSDPNKQRSRGQFSRRKLVDNSWRYEEPEEDPNLSRYKDKMTISSDFQSIN